MNERIKECWLKAAREDSGDNWDTQEEFIERFAELIVKECASMARVYRNHEFDFTGDLELDEFMLKHFGVE